jgi:type IV pilus assembly protein PilW
MKGCVKNIRGFTVVELMLAMTLASVVMGGVYLVYSSQQKSFKVQEQAAGIQQNLRASLYLMEKEMGLAGCMRDPARRAGAGIVSADASSIRFTMDIRGGETDGTDNNGDGIADDAGEASFGDGDTNDKDEDITYSLYSSGGIQKLGRKSPSTASNQPVAENIDALNFVYLDGNGNVLPTPVANPAEIRAIQITVIARANKVDQRHTDTVVYKNQQGTTIFGPLNDNFRRKLMTTQVSCRNLGS